MATRLGPAQITVTLDVRQAQQQLNQLAAQIQNVAQQAKGVPQPGHGARLSTAQQARGAQALAAELRKREQAPAGLFDYEGTGLGGGSVFQRALRVARNFYALDKFADILPKASGAFKAVGGAYTAFASEGIDQMTEKLDSIKAQVAKLTAILPTIDKMTQVLTGVGLATAEPNMKQLQGMAWAEYGAQQMQRKLSSARERVEAEALGFGMQKVNEQAIALTVEQITNALKSVR